MSEDSSFIAALAFNAAVGAGMLLFFSVFRRRVPQIYSPRLLEEEDCGPPKQRGGIFGWVYTVCTMSDEAYYTHAGLDALMYTSFLKFGICTFAVCSLFGLALLMPINYSAYGGAADCTATNSTTFFCTSSKLAGLTAITLANIPPQDTRLWAHFVSAYIFVLTALFFLERLYRKFVTFRLRFFAEGRAHCHTVLVRDVPSASATAAAVRERFERLYGAEVLEVEMVYPAKVLARFLAARGKAEHRLDHLRETRKVGKAPRMRVGGCLGVGGELVDEKSYLTTVVGNLDASIATQQARLRSAPPLSSSALVTFRRIATATAVVQSLFSTIRYTWTVTAAPEARDVHWRNVRLSYHMRTLRGWLVHATMAVLVVFWAVPVTAVASLTTLDRVTAVLPFLRSIVDSNQAIRAFLEGVLPTLALVLFMAILPYLLHVFATFQGFPSHSDICFSVMRKLFYFQVVNVFFVSLIAGTVFTAINDLASSPESVLTLLGEAVPRTGVFFTNYVMLRAFSLYPGNLARVFDLLLYKIRMKWFSRTPAARAAAAEADAFEYHSSLPTDLLIILIGLTYATVAPLMLPFTVAYFGNAFIVNRYNMLYVHSRKFETGGLFLPNLFDRIMAAVLIYELTMVGILSLKQAVLQVPLLIPLIVYTLHFWVSRNRTYRRIGTVMALDAAACLPPLAGIANQYEIPELRTTSTPRKAVSVFSVLSKLGSAL